jgi:hypothetical protein
MQTKYLPENTNPQNSDWLLTENDTAAQKLSVGNLLALAGTPDNLGVDNITGLQTALDNKANYSDINALATTVTSKASQASVDVLTTTVSEKIDKFLIEISSADANDFLILEKASDNSNKKIKVSTISNNLSVVITNSAVPSTPTPGLIWNEIDATGNLIESWTWLNSQWVSSFKITDLTIPTNTIAGTIQYNFPLESDDNIFFRAWSAFWQSNISTDANNYYQIQLRIYNGATEILNNPPSPGPINFNNNPATIPVLLKASLDKKYTTANMFIIILFRWGNPGSSILLGVKVKYQLIRK